MGVRVALSHGSEVMYNLIIIFVDVIGGGVCEER